MPNKQFEPYEYAPTEVLHGYAQWAMRAAVFGPLFSREVFAVQDVPQMLTDVRKRWHSRLLSLHEEGWARVSTARKLRYCMNCPPFGVKTGTSANCCLFVRFCPFCWARKVPSLYYDRLLLAKDRITNLKLEGVEFPATQDFDLLCARQFFPLTHLLRTTEDNSLVPHCFLQIDPLATVCHD